MPTYRVHDRDMGDRTVQAVRVITDGAEVCFENQIAGRWQSALALPAERVLRLQRRVNEHDGRWRWIIARPELVAGRHAHF
jgi:hypothetical protein